MSWIDTAVVAVYLAGMTLFGCSFMFKKGLGDADGFMTGSGRLPTWTVALSIFATHVSSIAFLGLPAKSFLTNWNPYVLSLTVPLAAVVAALWFVPFYRSSGCVSAYSFLEARYGTWARLYESACFLLFQTTRSGFILFLAAILMNTLFGWQDLGGHSHHRHCDGSLFHGGRIVGRRLDGRHPVVDTHHGNGRLRGSRRHLQRRVRRRACRGQELLRGD